MNDVTFTMDQIRMAAFHGNGPGLPVKLQFGLSDGISRRIRDFFRQVLRLLPVLLHGSGFFFVIRFLV